MLLPTTKEQVNSAIGWYIHDLLAPNMERLASAPKTDKLVWDKIQQPTQSKTAEQALKDFVAMVRARKS